MRGPGGAHGMENRRSMCPFTCDPRPRSRRPFEARWISHAAWAITYGERGNARATPVVSTACSVASAAAPSMSIGSNEVSFATNMSKPSASARVTSGGISRNGACSPMETRM